MTADRVNGGKRKAGTLTREKKEGGRLSATLEAGLRAYAIGERLRALRLKKKMGLVELGQHTGLSPALLSKLERGRLFPTLPTLLRIALVFSVDLQYFFAGPRERPVVAVVRRKDRVRLPDAPGAPAPTFFFESLDYPVAERKLNAYYAEFPDRKSASPLPLHSHPGAEVIYVIKGSLKVQVGEEDHVLDEGDSMYFDCTIPHGYARHKGATAAVVVTG